MKTSYHSRHHIVIFENYIPVQVIFKHSHTVIHTGTKLTAREDRESRNMMNFGEQSVYTRTQLSEGGQLWVFYTWTQPSCCPTTTSLQQFSYSISKNPKFRITLCAPVCSTSSQTGVTLEEAIGVTSGPSLVAYFTIILEKVESEIQIKGLLDIYCNSNSNINVILVVV